MIEFARGIIFFFFECLILFCDETLEPFAEGDEMFVFGEYFFGTVFDRG